MILKIASKPLVQLDIFRVSGLIGVIEEMKRSFDCVGRSSKSYMPILTKEVVKLLSD
jgi:hypothetical protein